VNENKRGCVGCKRSEEKVTAKIREGGVRKKRTKEKEEKRK
jgi:hypothetical protein